MSNRFLTFSLTSLIFLIALIAVPVMAQDEIDRVVDFGTSGTFGPDGTTALTIANSDELTSATYILPGGYLIITKEDPSTIANVFLPASVNAAVDEATATGAIDKVQIVQWANMPNLEDLFYRGGTLLLKRTKYADAATQTNKIDHDGDDDLLDENGRTLDTSTTTPVIDDGKKDEKDGAVVAPADADAATATRDIGIRDLIITEIMWAKDLNLAGADGEFDHQWIEIHNPLGTTVSLEDVVLHASNTDPAIDAGDGFIKLDRVSNNAGLAWDIMGLGQNGSTATGDGAIDFVSMYRSKRDGDGENRGHWMASSETYLRIHKGTPGAKERTRRTTVTPTDVKNSPFIINEVSTGGDWIELKNVSDTEQSLKNYQLSQVTKPDTDKRLVSFHDKDYKVGAGKVILIVSGPRADGDIPSGSMLAGGINVATPAADRVKVGATAIYWVPGKFNIEAGESLLILRNNHEDKHLKTAAHVVDITGGKSLQNAAKTSLVWPIVRAGAPHDKVIDGAKVFDDAKVYKRDKAGGFDEASWSKAGFTGIGYKRKASMDDAHGGTPGYDNGAAKVYDKKSTDTAYMMPPVTISEIMYHSARNAPQWIELYNSSMTEGVQLEDWQLKLENMDDVPMRRTVTVKLANKIIPPNQTVLIVAFHSSRTSSSDGFPDDREIDLWTDGLKEPDKLEIETGTSRTMFYFLSSEAFKITLMDKAGVEVDTAGNYVAGADPAWELPASEGNIRASIIRRYNTGTATGPSEGRGMGKGMAQDGTLPVWSGEGSLEAVTGMKGMDGDAGWTVAIAQDSYYGSKDDLGSPGYRAGGPLPVSLSKFRPERLESGEIVIRWITESELNNAGFNILRSKTRSGEFVKVNTSLIAGQGTTSERTTYEWKDTSAKPNVVYYYQIQDVSLDGKVTTLRQTRLKGDVSPAGKLTVTWGELKTLRE